jgi:hypothetical protein
VQELLHESGSLLNAFGHQQAQEHLAQHVSANPWYVCFAIGLCWGHLARLELDFTTAVVRLLDNWNAADLAAARQFHLERGPNPISESLSGAYTLFRRVALPPALPATLDRMRRAQERWLSPILGPDRPRYIGSWNATAMFMAALFAQPALAEEMVEPVFMLPPGGPIHTALGILNRDGVSPHPPAGTALDDEAFEPGALYENNAFMAELLRGHRDWSMLDLHSGLYLLGTRDLRSAQWV